MDDLFLLLLWVFCIGVVFCIYGLIAWAWCNFARATKTEDEHEDYWS